ncbi:MAG TPA: aldehyde ferredoxin oxidoreductase family protein [Deltaproteobacteria bacterium]|nr:aldehyde ferredoxin oxidoreductase family protein [Deltaproteobacteria bacterium]OQC28160.1 MAG: putative oxidoreductase YdhV [Deltaproteobacteria bacterium ADurb.Bin072]HRW81185.1 aldehyde ferredoxin oxidoreductase family protein [Desulfomonilia bacterium]HNQ86455.1 aldehyde ferredoxin oxidoreductase family protein [Deltaproteobacteria bacterium]HNS90823.1 aldehyde ferredoxin oxidoreductase family protein [Deltaproteobacteria bacterium]
MPRGYAGKYLLVDLSAGSWSDFTVDEEILRDYLGGSSLAAKLFFDRYPLDADPLSGQNPLMIMTGPMVGSGFPGTSRFSICAKAPQTGIWGESACGGTFGPELKRAGYDGLVVEGISSAPVTLCIVDGKVELQDASSLWGKDVYETTDALKEKDARFKVLTIGAAGENLVKIASIGNDKGHFSGRTGLGAVMGSKKLKAIVVRGSAKPLKADEERYKTAFKSAITEVKESALADGLHLMGSDANMDLGMVSGDVPIKNWTVGEAFDLSSNLSGPTMREKYLTKEHACANCPVACKRVVKVDDGPYMTEEGPGPEYETCGTFGTMMMNPDLAAVIKANELCNRYGLDTISCGSTIALAMELYEKGILSKGDLDGIDLTWGNMEAVMPLIRKIAYREGIGDILAEGSLRAARRIGKGAEEYVVHVKGLEAPMHDPRGFHGMGLAYMMSNRGACHLQHAVLATEQGMASWPELFDMKDDYVGTTSEGKAMLVYNSENYGILGNSLSICHYLVDILKPETILEAFNAITGFGLDKESLLKTGMRDWTLKRGINNLLGITKKDDALPKKLLTALEEGGAAGSVPDVELLLSEYYAVRGLDDRGYPLPEKLTELGLEDLKRRLYQ